MKSVENPIILALDGMDSHEALVVADGLKEVIGGVKVNDLLDVRGVGIIKDLKKWADLMVMADPKIKDIPRAVARRVGHFVNAGADLVTIMADNTLEAMEAAADATKGSGTKVVAVTVLTSINEEECNRIYGRPTKAGVFEFAMAASVAGVSAVVCSPNELKVLERWDLIKITPGIRPAGMEKEDQKRVNTPGAAIRAGANYLVIGSAILKAGDGSLEARKEAAQRILEEINAARAVAEGVKKEG